MLGVFPLFGLVSAGVELTGGLPLLFEPLPLAVLLGLFLGKQLGIFGSIWLAVKAGVAAQPGSASWRQLYGAATLCGIGFTMSLFIGALAFPADPELVERAKIGTLAGSILSALAGYALLRSAPGDAAAAVDLDEAGELFGADQAD